MKWSSPPYRRSYSLDVSESGRVLCFGGCAGSDDAKDSVFGDLWLFDPETRLWDYEVRAGSWPEPRYGHSSVFVPKTASETLGGCLIVYGGRTFDNGLLDDLWLWREDSGLWTRVEFLAGSERPAAACYSTLTLIDQGRLLLYGGQTQKASRGSKMMWLFEKGAWRALSQFEARPRRFRHCAWYDHAQKRFLVYGGISGSAWHVDVYVLSMKDLDSARGRPFRILPPATGIPETAMVIQSEVCVNLDASHVLILGTRSAHVLSTVGGPPKVVAVEDDLPTVWKGNSPGVHACLVAPLTVLVMNLLPKQVSPILELRLDGKRLVSRVLEPNLLAPVSKHGAVCHCPPNEPVHDSVMTLDNKRVVFLKGDRWERWLGEDVDYFVLPANPSNVKLVAAEHTAMVAEDKRDLTEMSTFERSSVYVPTGGRVSSINDALSSAAEDDEDREDTMPLLYVRQQRQRSILKRIVDALVEWEKRGAVDTLKKKKDKKRSALGKKTALKNSGDNSSADEDYKDDELDLDCFGRNDDERKPFDTRHFLFTIFRGLFMFVFALWYLFLPRFTGRLKLALIVIGLVNAGCYAMPIVAYTWPAASDIRSETTLIWAPFVLYVMLVLVQASVEGNWRDNGGQAASIKYLDRYTSQVWIKQTNASNKRSARNMRGGELITNLIEYEESVMADPWEYWFLCFILSPFVGMVKAGLFILVDYLLVSHQIVALGDSVWVHVVFAISMVLNAVMTTAFMSLLAISAYIYRRQLRLLRLISAIMSRKQSAKLGIPYLPLRSVANVRVWSAMRTFGMSDRSYLPLVSANSMTGFGLVILGVLWIVITVSVFVERSRKQLLVPLNVSLGFLAAVLFYFAFVAIRQHFLINRTLRSHAPILGREKIRVQLAVDVRGEKSLIATANLMNHVHDILKIEMSYFRLFGGEIQQNSINTLLALAGTLSVATITNVVIDIGNSG